MPNTDWDGLDAGFIRPGVTKKDELDHNNLVRPDNNTLYKKPHLLNSGWNLLAMSARIPVFQKLRWEGGEFI